MNADPNTVVTRGVSPWVSDPKPLVMPETKTFRLEPSPDPIIS